MVDDGDQDVAALRFSSSSFADLDQDRTEEEDGIDRTLRRFYHSATASSTVSVIAEISFSEALMP